MRAKPSVDYLPPFVNAVSNRLRCSSLEAKGSVEWALKDLIDKLSVIKPRVIDVNSKDPPVLPLRTALAKET